MESGCSKNMTRNTKNFLSLKSLQGVGVYFAIERKDIFWVFEALENLLKTALKMFTMCEDQS